VLEKGLYTHCVSPVTISIVSSRVSHAISVARIEQRPHAWGEILASRLILTMTCHWAGPKRFYRFSCEIRALCHKLRNSRAKRLMVFFLQPELRQAKNFTEDRESLVGVGFDGNSDHPRTHGERIANQVEAEKRSY
jgi:hypothetical protein